MSRWLSALAIFLCLVSPASGQSPILGLDHIPIAVRDLDRAAADFAALGFVLKPGRPHANGLRNLHAKFPDGTELELITASAPTDELSRRCVDWLQQGEGPVMLGLFSIYAYAVSPPLPHLFFGRRQASPTDRPEHFAHLNSAVSLRRAWLAGDPAADLLRALAQRVSETTPACSPLGAALATLYLPEGEIVLLPAPAQRLPDRPIVGATVTVRSLATVRRIVPQALMGCTNDSLWVETHGLWLGFRER